MCMVQMVRIVQRYMVQIIYEVDVDVGRVRTRATRAVNYG